MTGYLIEYKVYGFYGNFSNYVEASNEVEATNLLKAAKLKALTTVERVVKISAAEIPVDHPYYDNFGYLRAAKKLETNNVQYGC